MGARRVEPALLDAAAVMAAWGGLLLGENVAVGFVWRQQFAGAWEFTVARHTVVPMAFAALAPASLAMVAGWDGVCRAAQGHRGAERALGIAGALAAGAVAFGVSSGRHLSNVVVRAVFVLLLAALGALFGARVVPRVGRLSARPPLLGLLGLGVSLGAWWANAFVLPRLYPAFHAAMLAGSILGAGLVGLAFRRAGLPVWVDRAVALAIAALVGLSVVGIPKASRALDDASNVRVTLVEHAPLLGPAVALATAIRARVAGAQEDAPSPAGAAGEADAGAAELAPSTSRALDWTGHDLLLISVDALRADHVSAYGYARPTPNIDALAREGTLFEHAYCPTPHTSYSLTSMMTGKYVRPLLALGMGADSETWAQALRRYGWRTAAFYPPAVFFIDQDRFKPFEEEELGFEYAKVEFADPALRERQVAAYLDAAPAAVPLFLWVHLFEPHEPYVVHPDHVFRGGAADVDAYDSEVAEDDDAIGALVRMFRARRPGAAVIVTADHGEEFGEHGGRYHGTTVYEEQVRVPLVLSGPGVRAGARATAVAQTIDLLPTVLSAYGMPLPARLRGRDLGAILAGQPAAQADPGFAFAETDDYALVASGGDRLVCERKAAACALYAPAADPGERVDVAREHPERFAALRASLRRVERDHGRFEATGTAWPEPLRRGMQGEVDAALDVAALLDDADVTIRRKAAEVCFGLRVADTVPAVRRALASDEDEEVRRWSALALARMGEAIAPRVDALLADPQKDWRRRAALTLGDRGEAKACDEIAAWWRDVAPPAVREARDAGTDDGEPPRLGMDLPRAQELLAATAKARCRAAVPSLERALEDVRARPFIADALGAIGDPRSRRSLRDSLAAEPYVTAIPHEAKALFALGAYDWAAGAAPAAAVHTTLTAPPEADAGAPSPRLVVLLSDAAATLDARADGAPLTEAASAADVRVLGIAARPGHRLTLDLSAQRGGVVALWLLAADRLD